LPVSPLPFEHLKIDAVVFGVGHGYLADIPEGGGILRVVAGVRQQESVEVDTTSRRQHQHGGGLHTTAVADYA
jgi:hypothetical protein